MFGPSVAIVKEVNSLLNQITEDMRLFPTCTDMSSQTRLTSSSWCPRTWYSVWCSSITTRASPEQACPTPLIPPIHPARRARPSTPSLPATDRTAAAKHARPVTNRSKKLSILAFIERYKPSLSDRMYCMCGFTTFREKVVCVFVAFIVYSFVAPLLLCACGPCLEHTELWPLDHRFIPSALKPRTILASVILLLYF